MTRDTILTSLCALSIGCLAAIRPVEAGTPQCAPRPDLLKILADKHGESRQSMGLARNGSVIETFAAESGSWTILVTRPDGISCLLAAGSWFEGVDEITPDGEPA